MILIDVNADASDVDADAADADSDFADADAADADANNYARELQVGTCKSPLDDHFCRDKRRIGLQQPLEKSSKG